MMPTLSTTTRPTPAHLFWRLAILATLLLGFWLRAATLDMQSLWSDEGISLQRAQMPLAEMLAAMPVEHVPGYFVLLHGWIAVAGTEDFALRFLSLIPSLLAVALIYRLGRELAATDSTGTAPLVATGAALLLATGMFQVWYAQEARMYTWLLASSLLATWALWRLVVAPARHTGGWLVVYALALAACVYLHFYGALVPITHSLFVAGWCLVRRDGRAWLRWLAASALALLLFAPWLGRALAITAFEGWREPASPAALPWRYLAAYTAGDAMPAPWHGWLPWVYLGLMVAGTACWWRLRRAAAALLTVSLLAPMAAVLALALRNPDYHERYAIFVTGPLLLLAAGGAGCLNPRLWSRGSATATARAVNLAIAGGGLALLLLAGANLLAVQRVQSEAALQKPDYRSAAARISAGLAPGDVVLVDGPDPSKVFLHYFSDDVPVHSVGALEDASLEEAGAELRSLTAGAGQVWEVLYFHPPATVQVWLATQGWATEPTDHNGIRVTRYGLAAGTPLTLPLEIAFGPALTLASAEVSTTTPRPGDLLRLSTHWQVHAPPPEYKFSLRLVDAAGQVVQSVDYVPQNWFAPTNVWLVGQPATDQRGLLLPDDLPPGDYQVTLRLYDPASGAAVATAAGEDVPLATLSVQP